MHAGHVAATYRSKRKKSAGVIPRPRTAGDSGKKGARGQGSSGWTALSEDSWVLGVGGDIRSHDTAIVSGSLFARAVNSANLDIGIKCMYTDLTLKTMLTLLPGDHMPRRPDSMFLHPDTMRLCGMGIGQPVAVRNADGHNSTLVVCKPWPLRKIELDGTYIHTLHIVLCELEICQLLVCRVM